VRRPRLALQFGHFPKAWMWIESGFRPNGPLGAQVLPWETRSNVVRHEEATGISGRGFPVFLSGSSNSETPISRKRPHWH